MTYEIYRYIFLGGTVLTIIMFIVSVLVFFLLNIPNVIGDLTGSNARKAIEDIRNSNERTGEKTYRTSPVNRERGKLTDKISASGRLIKSPSRSLHGAMSTEKISTQQLKSDNEITETVLLSNDFSESSETTVLSADFSDSYETSVLGSEDYINGTSVLNSQSFSNEFIVEYEITYVHTNEIIA